MSDEYVRKQDAVSAVEFGITLASAINIETGEWTELFQRENDELREAVERIKDIKPADVIPVVHAHWIRHDDADVVEGYYVPEYECSKCRAWKKDDSDFCPDCGAKMDEKE